MEEESIIHIRFKTDKVFKEKYLAVLADEFCRTGPEFVRRVVDTRYKEMQNR